ncbi:MAG: ISAs1 family transposase [Nautiliaceae bacterium]
MKFNTSLSNPIDTDESIEKNRGRIEKRKAEVYDDLYLIDTEKWKNLKRIIKVTRETKTIKTNKISKEISYYISSATLCAKEFNKGIRLHWSIENSLHYVKDVTFDEDNLKIKKGNAPEMFSLITNVAINAFRNLKYTSIKSAVRLLGGEIDKLLKLL